MSFGINLGALSMIIKPKDAKMQLSSCVKLCQTSVSHFIRVKSQEIQKGYLLLKGKKLLYICEKYEFSELFLFYPFHNVQAFLKNLVHSELLGCFLILESHRSL